MSAQGPTEGARRGLAGRVLGDRYRVERMVSAGASTLIADAEDTAVGRAVTIKLVRPEIAESPEFRRKFEATMRAMSKLSHPNIAAVHDWGEEEVGRRTTVYAVVERLAGGSLRDVFDRGRRLDPSQALMVGLEACRGLDFAHRKRLVHGELTPSKLVFGDDRRLRIVDFGLARLLGAEDWREPSTVPTHVARYSSPEQALGQPIDGKSDVYSLALILVEAVSGAVPFAARSTVATLSARVGRLMPVSADLGPLAAVLERAGRPDPADRSTASEFGRGLVRAAEKLPRPTPIPIVVTKLFEDDPSQLRRPNDPTGGVDRPPPEPVVPLVTPADEPAVAAAAAESTIAAAPEERAAAASIGDAAAVAAGAATAAAVADLVSGAAGAGHDATALLPAADAPTTAQPAVEVGPPAPATPGVAAPDAGPPSPDATAAVYDGDVDLLRDELAALAQPPAEPAASTGAPPSAAALLATGPPAGPPLVGPPPAAAPPPPPPAATEVVPTAGATGPGWSAPLESLDAGRKRRRWVPWVIALVVVAALAGLGLLALQLFEVPEHPVPDLVGSDEATARAETADFDWDIEVRHERSDEFRTPGEIIRTAPTAGQELAEEEPFLIVVSDGPEFRALEDLVGLTRAEAETKLAEQELVALPAQEQPDEDVPAGSVVSWSVPDDASLTAGGEVLPGTTVQLVVSSGPAPRTVPTLVGTTVEQATAALQAIQLGVTVAEPVFSDDVPAGSVVSANPPDGTGGIARGTAVTITPSKGVDLVPAPTLIGLTLQQARDALTASGLQLGSVLGNTQAVVTEATVAGELMAPGGSYKRGTTVDLVLL